MNHEVIIIGAGLAGLTCARRLQEAGRSCVVLESGDTVGGRVGTRVVGGFQLDLGFQVLLTAYPEAQRWLDYARLELRPFAPGAQVQLEAGRRAIVADPWRRPQDIWATLCAPVGSLADKLRIAALRARACRGTLDELWARPETTTAAALQAQGFGAEMRERFLRPWLGGIFLERELVTSSRMMEFVFRMFAEGDAALPARGMRAIPEQLAAGLAPGSVRLETEVAAVEPGRVRLLSGETLQARHLVVAVNGTAAARLLPGLSSPEWRGTTTLYFDAPHSSSHEPFLLLNGTGHGRINHLAVPSAVQPRYAPPGRSLLAVSLHGDTSDEDDALLANQAQTELGGWLGAEVRDWRCLQVMHVRRALPVRWPLVAEPVRPWAPGLWLCGDFRDSASIQGAMVSGRATAEALLAATDANP